MFLKISKELMYWLRNFRCMIPANVNISGTTLQIPIRIEMVMKIQP